MKQHHPSCEPDTEPCACKALARNDAAWSSVDRRHWPSYAAGINDAPCTRCGGKGLVYVPSTIDPGDVVPDVCEACRG
jgi:hypothetical protein